jgi:hypothetical protein
LNQTETEALLKEFSQIVAGIVRTGIRSPD